MIYVDKYSVEEWEQKFPCLKLHPTMCPDCKQTRWEDGFLYPWISKEYVGILRVCQCCKKHQDTVAIIDKQKSLELYYVCDCLLREEE